MTRTINARYAGDCICSRSFARGAKVTIDATRRVISCYDCTTARKAETQRRLAASISGQDPRP